jgi:hypothetical protein
MRAGDRLLSFLTIARACCLCVSNSALLPPGAGSVEATCAVLGDGMNGRFAAATRLRARRDAKATYQRERVAEPADQRKQHHPAAGLQLQHTAVGVEELATVAACERAAGLLEQLCQCTMDAAKEKFTASKAS